MNRRKAVGKGQLGNFFAAAEQCVVREKNQTLRSSQRGILESLRQVIRATKLPRDDLDAQCGSRFADVFEEKHVFRKAAPEHCDPLRSRKCIDEKLEALPAQDRITVSHSGEVCAWPRDALDDTEPNRIRNEAEHHRRCHADVFERTDGWGGQSNDHVRLLVSELIDKCAQTGAVSLSAVEVNRRRPPLLVAQRSQLLEEHMNRCAIWKATVKDADPRQIECKCVRGQSPGGGRAAAQQDYELPPLHSITSSARASSTGVPFRPSLWPTKRQPTRTSWQALLSGHAQSMLAESSRR